MVHNSPARIASLLDRLVAFRTDPDGHEHAAAAAWIAAQLRELGFTVQLPGGPSKPLIEAHRPASAGASGHVLLYGHYDVDEVVDGWESNPFQLVERDGRWVGLGVGDNKGALAARLTAIRQAATTPALTLMIQGEEETGSQTLREHLRTSPLPTADWYVDENGWRSADGVERVLACVVGTTGPEALDDGVATALLATLTGDAPAHLEQRRLNKVFVPGGCAFQEALPNASRYLAVGTNDAGTRIHQPNESISVAAAAHHAAAMERLLQSVAHGGLRR